MKLLRRRVRRSFLFAAIGFLVIGLLDVTRQDYANYGISSVHHFGFIAFCLLQGGIYAAAWFTTKKPSPYRNNWAVAGSLFTLAWAGFDLWLHHSDVMAARGGIIGLILAIAGLYVFGQGGEAPRPEPAAIVPTSEQQSASARLSEAIVSGPGPAVAPPAGRIARVYKVPAQGSASSPAIAASASSPALAAAANSLEAPAEPRWDPLSFIRGKPSGA